MSRPKNSGGRRSPSAPRRQPADTGDNFLRIPFTKMHGLGNDFVVLDMISNPVQLSTAQIRSLGDRHRGIGFDQLLVIDAPRRPDADFHYRIYNADGSEVEHCGNGARCFARFVLDRGLIARGPIRVQTQNRLLALHTRGENLVSVDMGEPDFNPATLPFEAEQANEYQLSVDTPDDNHAANSVTTTATTTATFFAASMGNPHIVLVTDNCDTAPVDSLGTLLCTHPAFPRGVNVGFMQIIDRRTIRLRVHERGAGETEACGTGACAAVACGIRAGLLDEDVTVQLKGGDLQISWQGPGQPVIMTGPAETVYEGTITLAREAETGATNN